MFAVRWHGHHDVRLDDIPRLLAAGEGEYILDVTAAGICGTDIHEWMNGPLLVPLEPHALSGRSVPITLGHEFVGTITDAGPRTRFPVGARVAVEVNRTCGRCRACLEGQTQLCPRLASLGLSDDGGLAEQVVVPDALCVRFESLSPLDAVLAEPLAVAVRTERLLDLEPLSSVLVIGAGAVGQLTQRLLTSSGHTVWITDRVPARLVLADAQGAAGSAVVDDLGDLSQRATDGLGFDAVIDTAGAQGTAALAIRQARRGGRVALVGADHRPLDVAPLELVLNELTIQAVLSHTMVDFDVAMAALTDGRVSTTGIVTRVVPLSDALTGGFEELRDQPESNLKVVISPDAYAAELIAELASRT